MNLKVDAFIIAAGSNGVTGSGLAAISCREKSFFKRGPNPR